MKYLNIKIKLHDFFESKLIHTCLSGEEQVNSLAQKNFVGAFFITTNVVQAYVN